VKRIVICEIEPRVTGAAQQSPPRTTGSSRTRLSRYDHEADPIYAHMVAGRAYPQSLFVAPPALEADLRRRPLIDTAAAR
jgi:hypothetical protein